jgi:hypothetical protein
LETRVELFHTNPPVEVGKKRRELSDDGVEKK